MRLAIVLGSAVLAGAMLGGVVWLTVALIGVFARFFVWAWCAGFGC